jgi:hypothetical protein
MCFWSWSGVSAGFAEAIAKTFIGDLLISIRILDEVNLVGGLGNGMVGNANFDVIYAMRAFFLALEG